MSKNHLQGVAEQISKTGHASAPFHHEKMLDLTSKPIEDNGVRPKMLADDVSIRQLAYEIFQEKGGNDLDNWFEAEKTLNNNY